MVPLAWVHDYGFDTELFFWAYVSNEHRLPKRFLLSFAQAALAQGELANREVYIESLRKRLHEAQGTDMDRSYVEMSYFK